MNNLKVETKVHLPRIPIRPRRNFILQLLGRMNKIHPDIYFHRTSNQRLQYYHKVNPKASKQTQTDFSSINFPGIQYALDRNQCICIRLIWIIAITVCTVLAIFQIGERFRYYYQYPTVVNVKISERYKIELPKIILCPIHLETVLGNVTLVKKGKQHLNESFAFVKNYMNDSVEELWSKINISQDRISFHSSCSSKKKFDQQQLCNVSFELKPQITIFGQCQQISFKNSLDYFGGFTYFQISYQDDYDDVIINVLEDNDKLSFKFYLSNEEDFRINNLVQSYHKARLAKEYWIDLMTQEFINRNTPKNPCKDCTSVTECWNQCVERKLAKVMSCRLPFLRSLPLPPCGWSNALKNFQMAWDVLLSNTSDCRCARECKKIVYNLDDEDFVDIADKNSSSVIFYLPRNTVDVIQEFDAYSFNQLLSDVGGSLGFFLGCCVLSLLEIIHVVIGKIVRLYLSHRRDKDKKNLHSKMSHRLTTKHHLRH